VELDGPTLIHKANLVFLFANSNPSEVTGIFLSNLANPSSRTVAVGWTHRRTEMGTIKLRGAKGG
jgi:hypothetical protein